MRGMSESDALIESPPEPKSARTSPRIRPPAGEQPPQWIELITRTERRRRWSPQQKREIVAQSLAPGSSALATARAHGISSGQLYTWRSQARRGELDERPPTRFVRIDPHLMAAPNRSGLIEITLPGGAVLRVDAQVDAAALRRVLAALEDR